MFMKSVIGLCFVGFAMIGCGGDDTTTSTNDLSTIATGNDLAGAKLQAGTYNVTNIMKLTDGCGLVFEGDASNTPLATLQLLNTGTTLSLGNKFDATSDPMWNPAGYSAGTGAYTDPTHATLTSTATVTLADKCTYSTTRTTLATFTGNNAMTIDFTDSESNESASCATNGDQATACTSHYTFNLAM